MFKLVFASSNLDKVSEAKRIVGDSIKWISLKELGVDSSVSVEETGTTFAQNAYLKAKTYIKNSIFPLVGEDTGLCVKALAGKPGLHSNRWFPGTSHDRNIELLRTMADQTERSAEFVDVICLLDPKQPESPLYFVGRTKGQIVNQPRGNNGFGYDVVFQPEGSNFTYAEMTPAEKDQVSHRAKALHLMLDYIKSIS